MGRLVGVHVFIDEGQWLFNSHIREKAESPEAVAKRKLILHGGHYCRSLNVITQRTTNVFPDIRSQIAIWYHCEKKFSLGRVIIFQRSEIQDMKNGEPDMDAVMHTKVYFGKKRIYYAYNTHGMREQDAIVDVPKFEVYQLSFGQRFLVLLRLLPLFSRIMREKEAKPNKETLNDKVLKLRFGRAMKSKEKQERVIKPVMRPEDYPRTVKGFIQYLFKVRVEVKNDTMRVPNTYLSS